MISTGSQSAIDEIQDLQFSDLISAQEKTEHWLRTTFGLKASSVRLSPRPTSLNSFNGFATLDGQRVFFKSHVEIDGCASALGPCQEHDHGHSEKPVANCGNSVAGDPCECTHIQISETQCSTLISSSVFSGVERLVVFLTAIKCDLAFHIVGPPIDDSAMLLNLLHSPSPSLTVSASPVMQC